MPKNTHREDDELDIDAIIEANKDTLPVLPGASRPHSRWMDGWMDRPILYSID